MTYSDLVRLYFERSSALQMADGVCGGDWGCWRFRRCAPDKVTGAIRN